MQHLLRIVAAALVLAGLNSCASLNLPPLRLGQTEAQVIARLGKPTQAYQDGASRLLEYKHGRMGQTTEMARIGADGKLVSYEQVLSLQKFAAIKIGEATKETVLRIIGAPGETHFYQGSQLEAWSYAFKESDVWDSLMAVYFDKAGIVRRLENGPDPLRQVGGDFM